MTGTSTRRRWCGIAVGTLVIAVLIGSLAGFQRWRDRPPYGPEAVAAHAVVRMVDNDWLSDYGSTDSGGVFMSTDARGPVEFVALIPPSIARIDASDLTVSLVFLSNNGHVYWAQRLLD